MSERDLDRPTELAAISPIYLYEARVDRVVDGDTVDLTIDLGFEVHAVERVRLMDVDTAEIFGVGRDTEEYRRGQTHRDFVVDWVDDARPRGDPDWPFIHYSHEYERGAYGRVIGDIYARGPEEWLAEALLGAFEDVRYEP